MQYRYFLFIFILSAIVFLPQATALENCVQSADCETTPCSGAPICAGQYCQYPNQLTVGTCLDGWGQCMDPGTGVADCFVTACNKPNMFNCPEGQEWAYACDPSTAEVNDNGETCCDNPIQGGLCKPKIGQECYAKQIVGVTEDYQSSDPICLRYTLEQSCHSVWVRAHCDDPEDSGDHAQFSDLSGWDFQRLYTIPVNGIERTKGMELAASLATISGHVEIPETVMPQILLQSIISYTAKNTQNQLAYSISHSTVLQQAKLEIENEKYCRCEGDWELDVRYVEPSQMWVASGAIAAIAGGVIASICDGTNPAPFDSDQACGMMGFMVAILLDQALSTQPCQMTGDNAVENPEGAEVDTGEVCDSILGGGGGLGGFLGGVCGNALDGILGMILGTGGGGDGGGMIDLLLGGLDLGGLTEGMSVASYSLANIGKMHTDLGKLATYDGVEGGNLQDSISACERNDCGKGVFDTLLDPGKQCCGDDSTDDPDDSMIFCGGKDVIASFGGALESRSCLLGNLGGEMGVRNYVGKKEGGRQLTYGGECCGDDSGLIPIAEGGITQPTSDRYVDDCAQVFTQHGWDYDHVCWEDKRRATTEWLSAVFPGLIYYLPCADFEILSTGDDFLGCGDSGVFGVSGGRSFAGGTALASIRNTATNEFVNTQGDSHDYMCLEKASGKQSIAYCGDEDYVVERGGLKREEGFSVNYTTDVWYCAHYSTPDDWNFSTDLDSLDERGDPDGSGCEEARDPDNTKEETRWTGTYCCGEEDDYRVGQGESYNENTTNNFGACFRNVFQPNEKSKKNRLDGQKKNGLVYYDLYETPATNKGGVIDENHQFTELYIFNGTFHGCAISDLTAVDGGQKKTPYQGSFGAYDLSNDYLLSEKNHPNPGGIGKYGNVNKGDLITDHKFCAQIGPIEDMNNGKVPKWYCSYAEVWNETKGDNRSHLNRIPPDWRDPGIQIAECCQPTQCWNGTICVDSVHDQPSAPPIAKKNATADEGYRCVLGEWVFSGKKRTWDVSQAGFCPNSSQCLTDPAGNFTMNGNVSAWGGEGYKQNPICINDTQYIMDHYCENGNWTSRTKMIGTELIKTSSGDFELFCDSHEKVLNFVTYDPRGGSFVPLALGLDVAKVFFDPYPETKCKDDADNAIPCVNNFCVLVDDTKVSFGTSLNQNLSSKTPFNFMEVLELPRTACENVENLSVNEFRECSGGDGKVFYNPKLRLVLYSKDIKITPQSGKVNYYKFFLELIFRDFLKPMIDAILGRSTLHDYTFFERNSKDANKIYFAKIDSGNKKIFGIREEKYNKPIAEGGILSKTFAVDYIGFNVDVCQAVNAKKNMYCSKNSSDVYHAVSVPTALPTPEFDALWIDMTSRLRPNQVIPVQP